MVHPNMQRRIFLRIVSIFAIAMGANLLRPLSAFAAWPKQIFESNNIPDILYNLLGAKQFSHSKDIKLEVPNMAENGAVIPVKVTTSLPNVESISVIVEKNPMPLAAHYILGATAIGFIHTHIKMNETSKIFALVNSGGRIHSTSKEVKIANGHCGN